MGVNVMKLQMTELLKENEELCQLLKSILDLNPQAWLTTGYCPNYCVEDDANAYLNTCGLINNYFSKKRGLM
mgnify:CR=1 FL=1